MSYTELHICSYFGLDELILDFLDQGNLSIDTVTKIGSTPIMYATSNAEVSTVRLLLEKGADPYLENWYGNALHCAAEAGNDATIRELVNYGMSPNACERYCRSPLSCTLDRDSGSSFETLVTLGANINSIDLFDDSRLPILHRVAFSNCLNIMDLILKHCWGDLECKTEDGCTALHLAAEGGHLLMVRKLVRAGADIDAKDNQENTPLFYLAYHYEFDGAESIL